ncbi:MAG: M13 family metallopeptidase [Verrucomicrobia bacterium]|nr:M13 family metallopeptidase [Verrucomicrobiota bacterium]
MQKFSLTATFVALAWPLAAPAAIDVKHLDASVKPGDDFFAYANGGWMKANPVPAAYSQWGAFHEVDEFNKKALHALLEKAAKVEKPGSLEDLVGGFYASGMNESAVNLAGSTPLRPELERFARVSSPAEVQAALALLHRYGIRAGFFFTSEPDPKDSSMVIAGMGQGGLGLPDRDYYFRDDEKSKQLREHYVAHVARLLELAGDTPDAAKAAAAAVMRLETALAQDSKTNVELRDPVANYNKFTIPELQKLTPRFDWKAYFAAIGLAEPAFLDVGQPKFFAALSAQLEKAPLADWQAYLRWQLLHGAAPYLSAAFVNENFDFYGKTLTDAKELRDRWKRVLDTVDRSVGEALGQLYVAENFPPDSKRRMLALVENLRLALGDRLKTLEWMDEPTRAKALEKLAAFGVKIGYPDKWIDYSSLQLDRSSYVRNVFRAAEFNHRRDIAKIGRPVDKTEWQMSPPTVNAYYDPQRNEIVFPAGILQAPFFDPKADDAVNYGGIGAVIGHEMTHGFDDQGSQFDAVGNLTNWWTDESAKRFKERTTAIVKQFAAYTAIDELKLNGELTQGENIADLGGLKIAYAAFRKATAGQPAQAGQPQGRIDGFTPDQRFFLSWATVWHTNIRDAALRLQVNTDPHSPARFRVNGPLSNLPEFFAAFSIPDGAPMRRAVVDAVTIW